MGIGRFVGRRAGWQVIAARTVVRYGRQAWNRLEPSERAELRGLLTSSRGRVDRLSAADRAELRRLVTKMRGRKKA